MATLQMSTVSTPSRAHTVRHSNAARPSVRPVVHATPRSARRAGVTAAYNGGCGSGGFSPDNARRMFDAYARAMGIRPTPGGFSFPGGAFSMSGMNPEAEKAFKEMYKQWQQYMQSEMGRAGSSSPSTPSGTPSLPLDVTQDDLKYVVYADVPGLAKSDLSIKLSKDNILTISSARKPPVSAEETAEGRTAPANSFLLQQRPSGSFERKWTLPEDADTAAISAKVTDGVLMVTIGKKVAEPEVDDTQDIPWV